MMHCAHLTIHGYIGVGSHSAFPLPLPSIAPHIAMDTLLGYTLGAKYSKTVIGSFGFQFIGKGNDSGGVVPHLCIPPLSVLVPVVIAFGSSKPMFSASTVLIDVDGSGVPMAAALLGPVSVNQACNDPCNYPSDLVIAPNSVVVGLTFGDILGGFINIAIDMAISAVANAAGGWLGERGAHNPLGEWLSGILANRIGGRIASVYLSEFTKELTERFGREAAESMIRDAAGNLVTRGIHEVLAKLIEGQLGAIPPALLECVGVPEGDLGALAGTSYDQQPPDSPTEISSDLTNNSSGAAPIYDAY